MKERTTSFLFSLKWVNEGKIVTYRTKTVNRQNTLKIKKVPATQSAEGGTVQAEPQCSHVDDEIHGNLAAAVVGTTRVVRAVGLLAGLEAVDQPHEIQTIRIAEIVVLRPVGEVTGGTVVAHDLGVRANREAHDAATVRVAPPQRVVASLTREPGPVGEVVRTGGAGTGDRHAVDAAVVDVGEPVPHIAVVVDDALGQTDQILPVVLAGEAEAHDVGALGPLNHGLVEVDGGADVGDRIVVPIDDPVAVVVDAFELIGGHLFRGGDLSGLRPGVAGILPILQRASGDARDDQQHAQISGHGSLLLNCEPPALGGRVRQNTSGSGDDARA